MNARYLLAVSVVAPITLWAGYTSAQDMGAGLGAVAKPSFNGGTISDTLTATGKIVATRNPSDTTVGEAPLRVSVTSPDANEKMFSINSCFDVDEDGDVTAGGAIASVGLSSTGQVTVTRTPTAGNTLVGCQAANLFSEVNSSSAFVNGLCVRNAGRTGSFIATYSVGADNYSPQMQFNTGADATGGLIRGANNTLELGAASTASVVVGAASLAVTGTFSATGKASITANSGSCTLNGGSPSTCTVTVTASAKCQCTPVGGTAAIAAGGCAVGLSGTTLTATSANGLTNDVNILCDR